jgi:hypothetical protein
MARFRDYFLPINFVTTTLLGTVGLLAPPEVRQGKTSPELDTHSLVKQQIRYIARNLTILSENVKRTVYEFVKTNLNVY